MAKKQRADPYFSKIFHYLETGILPVEDKYARQIMVESEFFHL